VFLHAAVLGFVHPTTGAARRWRAELPSDLVAAAPSRPAPSICSEADLL